MGCKAAETTHSINNAFVPEIAGDKNLEDDECSGWPLEVDNNKLRVVIEADPLTTTWEVAAQFNINHSMVIWHLKQIGKFNKWVPHEPTENLKNCHFWSVIICNNNKTFLNRIVMCNVQWILYDNWWWPAWWLDWEEAPEHFPTPNLHQKMVMVTVWQSAVHLIHYSFLNSSGNYIWEVWSANQWDAPELQCLQLALVNRKSAVLLYDNTQPHVSQPMLQKLNGWGYEVLPYLPCSPHLLPTDYHFFKHLDNFLQGKHFHLPAGGRKYFPRVHWILKHGFLHYRNIG